MPGPPKKPTSLKLVEGTFRKDRAGNEPKPARGIPECPDHLLPEAKTEWARISKLLDAIGMLAHVDRAALAAYCQTWARWVDLELKVQKSGVMIQTAAGNVIENPYYSATKREREIMHRYMAEFGLTPAARAKINLASDSPQNTADPAEKYFGKSTG